MKKQKKLSIIINNLKLKLISNCLKKKIHPLEYGSAYGFIREADLMNQHFVFDISEKFIKLTKCEFKRQTKLQKVGNHSS